MQPLPDLGRILGPLRWVIVGGIALRAYMPERMTLDVDILVHEHDSAAARQAFIAAGYQVTGQLTIGGFTVQRPAADEPPVDVLTRSDSWLPDALDHPARDPAGYPVLARPYLILMKLQAGRTQDLADIQRLLARTLEAERLQIRTLIEQHSPELVEDFDSLRTLADLEFGPPPDAAS